VTALIIPFPLARRGKLIRRAAHDMSTRGYALGARDPAATGEKVLALALSQQRQQLDKRGIGPEIIESEIAALETAIRNECNRLINVGAVG
jgi:hypothetical protein